MKAWAEKVVGLIGIAALGLCATQLVASDTQQQQQARSSFFAGGYLPRGSAPDSLAILPPPPAPGSAALARDEEAANAALALRGSPRFEQAAIDADLFSPNTTGTFSCAAGVVIGPETTPRTAALLRKLGPDLALAVYGAKNRYQRQRPFMVNGQPTCTPKDEDMLRKDGSYPSGHSAIGYGWGLILAELIPARATQLVARGRSFGDSRRVCNVHWLSDVEEGRVMATATVARLHAEPAFRADMDAAREELARAPAATACEREAAALAN
jgi:acid phosphatase (class A)